MPPPRRPRDRLARALRATADRLSTPGSPDAPGSPDDVPRPPGQPPEHWRRLVATHAPGLLRDLAPPTSPVKHKPLTDSAASGSPGQTPVPRSRTGRRAVERLWRGWKALLAGRFGTSRSRPRSPHEADPGAPSRSWYERAPIGADSYQDLPQVLEGGTGISGVEKPGPLRRLARGAALPRPGAAVTRAGGGEGVAGSETAPATVGARCRSGDAVRPDDATSREGAPVCGCVASNGPAGSARSACIADGSGSWDVLGTSGIRSTPATGTGAATTETAGTRRTTEAGTGTPTGADRRTGPSGSRDTIGSQGRATSGDSASPSTPERWPGPSAARVDALRNLAQVRRSRARHRDDAAEAGLSPDHGDVLPLVFAAAPPSLPHGPAAGARGGRTGSAHGRGGTEGGYVDHHPGRATGSPYPDDPAPGGESRARQGQRPARPTPGSPWPALPDDAGPTRTTNPVGAGRATDGSTHADPWPALPGEPAWWTPATRDTPWSDTARLDREQAGD
ncbi:hypothetical protein F8279_14250 [Micromonospora sp. AMSO1212t]|nr:hypothetical protein F8279_14250 [Micromonospora sp. AMSO1212t]